MADPTLSVLLPVHASVDPDALAAALDSVAAQTRTADEIVIVEDGPLPTCLTALLDAAADDLPQTIRVRLEVNGGAGVANQAGLLAASGDWIGKVDSDDISAPERFEMQLCALLTSGADLCGSAMLEFDADPEHPSRLRDAPLSHASIKRRMRFNNPINHPTVVYRRKAALDCGGYPEFRYMQDYALFARMLAGGSRMMNLPEPLVSFRAGDAVHKRRHADGYVALERQLQKELPLCGVVGPARAWLNLVVRITYRKLPEGLMRFVNKRLLASRIASPSGTRTRGAQ